MKISQEDVILIKNLYLSKQYGARRVFSELPDKGCKLGSIDSLLKRSHNMGTIVPQLGVAVDLMLILEDKPKTHWSAREILHETGTLYSSVHRKIIHRDLQLTCFKRHHAKLLSWSQSYSLSHLLINNLIVCNKSCYSSIINGKLNNK